MTTPRCDVEFLFRGGPPGLASGYEVRINGIPIGLLLDPDPWRIERDMHSPGKLVKLYLTLVPDSITFRNATPGETDAA